jgi:hypothetical protein
MPHLSSFFLSSSFFPPSLHKHDIWAKFRLFIHNNCSESPRRALSARMPKSMPSIIASYRNNLGGWVVWENDTFSRLKQRPIEWFIDMIHDEVDLYHLEQMAPLMKKRGKGWPTEKPCDSLPTRSGDPSTLSWPMSTFVCEKNAWGAYPCGVFGVETLPGMPPSQVSER